MENKLTYRQALEYLFTFVDFSLTHQEQIAPERFELERMRCLLEKLDSPQQTFPSIHIAGTKGKGSVAAHCAAALQAGGYKTGLYTSPHLHDFRERIQINGQMIAEEHFAGLVEALKPAAESTPGITSYELQTALAFLYFAKEKVDVAVLEVGMGGRLDSTNVVMPLVSVIASISYDHTFILGNTLTEIAGEKGGIIKPGVPVVSSPQQEESLAVLEKIAADKGSRFTLAGRDLEYEAGQHDLSGQSFEIYTPTAQRFETGLLGPHQVENAVTAYAALCEVRNAGLSIDEDSIRSGFKQVNWPGRFEVVSREPALVFDGAHNRDSAKRLVEAMQDYFPGRPVTMVFGAMEDKDIAGMFAELLPHCQNLILTSANHPRAAGAERLQELATGYDCAVQVESDRERVLPMALGLADENGVVLVTGSLSVVGDFRALWFDKNGESGYN